MAEFYSIKKPDLSKVNKEKVISRFFNGQQGDSFLFLENTFNPYISWDKLKYKEPIPRGYSREELWQILKLMRKARSFPSPIKSENGKIFTWLKLPKLEKFFHEIDLNTGGELFSSKAETDKQEKQRLISRGIMEEAIASSQLEGASTSRKIAKQFLKEGRKPKNESEQMILNNYTTMKLIEEDYKDRHMDLDLLMELHGMITKDTLTPDGEKPKLRSEQDEIFVTDKASGIVYHKAPEMPFVKKELNRFIKFVNDESETLFVHPVIKAIMLHFWIGYLHPFTDGNGRIARLLFYWYLLQKKYWAFAYLPISKIIKKSPVQYTMAYVYSEQDDNDLTYFIDYHTKKIEQAVEEFKDYLDKQAAINSTMGRAGKMSHGFNERQVKLLQFLYGEPSEKTSIRIHMNVFQVANKTAIKDLKELLKLGFLEQNKEGKTIYYYITEKAKKLFL
ncbi:MAG: Fic family protein [Candidatus Falkowbacteria bacterium]